MDNSMRIPKENPNIVKGISGISYINIEKIRSSIYQTEKNFNKSSIVELANSIKTHGTFKPINVRPKDDFFELVSGEKYLIAAQLAGMPSVPCIIIPLDSPEMVKLFENLQKENLNFIKEAEIYASLINDYNLTQEDLALKIGKSQSTIANKIRLLNLSPIIRKIILDNNLTERHARAFLKIKEETLQAAILKKVCENKYTVKKTEEIIELNTTSKSKHRFYKNPHSEHHTVRDIKIFVNSIKESVDILKDSGVKAKAAHFDRGEYLEFIIRIPKKDSNIH